MKIQRFLFLQSLHYSAFTNFLICLLSFHGLVFFYITERISKKGPSQTAESQISQNISQQAPSSATTSQISSIGAVSSSPARECRFFVFEHTALSNDPFSRDGFKSKIFEAEFVIIRLLIACVPKGNAKNK